MTSRQILAALKMGREESAQEKAMKRMAIMGSCYWVQLATESNRGRWTCSVKSVKKSPVRFVTIRGSGDTPSEAVKAAFDRFVELMGKTST